MEGGLEGKKYHKCNIIPLKINMEHRNEGLEDYFPFQTC